jgi:phosphoribosylaminoimidazolecarboxamide formyltransferase/IMP cyclohydrolase
MGKNVVEKIDDQVLVRRVLISVSDKTGLESFVPELLAMNPELKIYSTGGTYQRLKEILGEKAAFTLEQVSDYTGQQETQGGLVKTLDFRIYLGLLTETYNESHQEDMKRTLSIPIDMVVVNLYPFSDTIKKASVTVEVARSNIDIGGPTMIRAAAKNYLRVASVVSPGDYQGIIAQMKQTSGKTTLSMRFDLAKKAFLHTAEYDKTISGYLNARSIEEVLSCYKTGGNHE